jgi:cytochrome oxidase Cu insertion factor (SCO1/SenC/PrrC family)
MSKRAVKAIWTAILLTSAAAAHTSVGSEALDFTLESLEGGAVSLSDFRGQVVLLNFIGYS